MMYSKRRTNLGRRSKKSSNRKLKRSNRLHMRGGSAPILECVELLNSRFPLMKENNRSVIRKTLNEKGCGLDDLKSHFNSFSLYLFGFSIRELLDAGFKIYDLLKSGLEKEIYTPEEWNILNKIEQQNANNAKISLGSQKRGHKKIPYVEIPQNL